VHGGVLWVISRVKEIAALKDSRKSVAVGGRPLRHGRCATKRHRSLGPNTLALESW
jgi:hypothetical protein